jgi:hypothetical protein
LSFSAAGHRVFAIKLISPDSSNGPKYSIAEVQEIGLWTTTLPLLLIYICANCSFIIAFITDSTCVVDHWQHFTDNNIISVIILLHCVKEAIVDKEIN